MLLIDYVQEDGCICNIHFFQKLKLTPVKK